MSVLMMIISAGLYYILPSWWVSFMKSFKDQIELSWWWSFCLKAIEGQIYTVSDILALVTVFGELGVSNVFTEGISVP